VLWQNARLVQISTTSTSIGINPNTAPAEVLATLPGVNPETAQRIMAHRKLQPITDAGQLATITSLPAQQFADDIGVIPSNTLRITQSAPGLAWAIQYNITLLPNSSEVPWRTEYYSRVPVPPLPMNPQTDTLPPVPPLPPRSTELPLPPPL
jgi:hypothetical protein